MSYAQKQFGGGSVVVHLLFNVLPIVCGGGGGGGSAFVFVFVCITLCPFYFCNYLEEEERAGCFAFIVLRMSCLASSNAKK